MLVTFFDMYYDYTMFAINTIYLSPNFIYKDILLYVNIFLLPYLEKSIDYIKTGGYTALNIVGDYFENQAMNDANFVFENIKTGGYTVLNTVGEYFNDQAMNDANFVFKNIKTGGYTVLNTVKDFTRKSTNVISDKYSYSTFIRNNSILVENKFIPNSTNYDIDSSICKYTYKLIENNKSEFSFSYNYKLLEIVKNKKLLKTNIISNYTNRNIVNNYTNTDRNIVNNYTNADFSENYFKFDQNIYTGFMLFVLFVFFYYFKSYFKSKVKKVTIDDNTSLFNKNLKEIHTKIDSIEDKVLYKKKIEKILNTKISSVDKKVLIVKKNKIISTQNIDKKLKIKKPKNIYNFFCLEERPKLQKEFTGYHYKEINAYLSLKWGILKDSFKEEDKRQILKYKNMVLQDIERYKKEINF